jgi:hypothetical protein
MPHSSVARQEKVRCRAYQIYEQRGSEDGHELDDWLQAELDMVPQVTRRKTMAAKFDLKQGGSGQFMFNLKAGNGEVILTSELYRQKAERYCWHRLCEGERRATIPATNAKRRRMDKRSSF